MKLGRIPALAAAALLALGPAPALAQKTSNLPAGSAVSSTDLVTVSQPCTGTPPTATCTASVAVSGAQLKTWAQSGLTCASLSNAGPGCSQLDTINVTVQAVDLHTATGDVAHFTWTGSADWRPQQVETWGCSSTSGSVTLQMFTGPGGTGTALDNSQTVTTFGGAVGNLVGTVSVFSLVAAGHDAYLHVTGANASTLTCNVTLGAWIYL